MNCETCSKEWKERYSLSTQRFDRQINRCMAVTIIAVCVSLICIIITAFCVVTTIKFISQFECVEETEYSIEQDGNGRNIAVLIGNDS